MVVPLDQSTAITLISHKLLFLLTLIIFVHIKISRTARWSGESIFSILDEVDVSCRKCSGAFCGIERAIKKTLQQHYVAFKLGEVESVKLN